MTGAGGTALRRCLELAASALLALTLGLAPGRAQDSQTPVQSPAAPAEAPASPAPEGATTPPAPTTPPAASPTPAPATNPALAQGVTRPTSTTVVVSKGSGQTAGPDYVAWERLAARAEALLANPDTEARGLELLRSQLAAERAKFLAAQNTNSTRIATVREQIAALGPTPPEGETEAAEIAQRRQQLADQLVRLQAPA